MTPDDLTTRYLALAAELLEAREHSDEDTARFRLTSASLCARSMARTARHPAAVATGYLDKADTLLREVLAGRSDSSTVSAAGGWIDLADAVAEQADEHAARAVEVTV